MDIKDNNYYVVKFLTPRDNMKYAIVPHSWILKSSGLVIYPEEDRSTTLERIKRNEQCKENWRPYKATIIYTCSHFDDAYCKLTNIECSENDDQASKERPKTDHNNSPGNSRGNVTILTNNIPIRNGNSIKDNKGDLLTKAQKRTISSYDQGTPSTSKIKKVDIKYNNNGSQNKKQTSTVESSDITNTDTTIQRNPVIMKSFTSSHDSVKDHAQSLQQNIIGLYPLKHLLGMPITESSQKTGSIPSTSKQKLSPPVNYPPMQTEHLHSQKQIPLQPHPISIDEKIILKKGKNTSSEVQNSPNIIMQDRYESMILENQDSRSNKIVTNLSKADNQLSNRLPNRQEKYDKSSYSEQLLPNTKYQESYSHESASNLPTNTNRKDSHINILENILIDDQPPSKSKNDSVKHNSPNAQTTTSEETDNRRSYKKDFIMQSDSQSLTEQSITNEELPIAESTSYQGTSTAETPVEKPNEESHGDKNTHPGNYTAADIFQAIMLTNDNVIKLTDIVQNMNKTDVANNEIVNNNNKIKTCETIKNTILDKTSTPTTSTDTTEISQRRKESTPKFINKSYYRAYSRPKRDTKNSYNANEKRSSRPLVLPPPEYNSNNSRWTLRHPNPGVGFTELVAGSHVYVSTSRLDRSVSLAKNAESLAILLLTEIFSDNALHVCTLTGSKRGLNLDQTAKKALLTFVTIHGIKNDWLVNSKTITNNIKKKIQELQRKYHTKKKTLE